MSNNIFLEALSVSSLITGYIQFFIGNWKLDNRRKNILAGIIFGFVNLLTFFLISYNNSIADFLSNKYVLGSIIVGFLLLIINIWIVNVKVKSLKTKWSNNPSKSILINLTNDLRFYSLKKEKSPKLNEALQIYLDSIMKVLSKWEKLSKREGIYKVCIARPISKGKFEFIAFRNIPAERLNSFRQKANWEEDEKERRSLFTKGVYQRKSFDRTISENDKDYEKFPEPPNYEPSKVHMVIPLKCDLYVKDKNIINGCLGVITISATELRMIPEEENKVIFDQLRPIVKGIEAILLLENMNYLQN